MGRMADKGQEPHLGGNCLNQRCAMTSGIHHVTAITRDVQANVDFWMGFLGLSLVKQTAGFEDADQLHLFYGDPAASPGSTAPARACTVTHAHATPNTYHSAADTGNGRYPACDRCGYGSASGARRIANVGG